MHAFLGPLRTVHNTLIEACLCPRGSDPWGWRGWALDRGLWPQVRGSTLDPKTEGIWPKRGGGGQKPYELTVQWS